MTRARRLERSLREQRLNEFGTRPVVDLFDKPVVDGVRCRFCRSLRATTDVTRAGDVTVCADCLGLMETILARAIRNLDPPE